MAIGAAWGEIWNESVWAAIWSQSAPVVIAPTMPANTSLSVDEGTTAVGTYTASSGSSPITYSLSGTDAASFSINSSTGLVAFLVAPDYETKASYSFDVVATNSADSDSQTVTVTINNVLEAAPTITTTGGTSITLTVGDTYSDPAWTWADDVVSGQAVTWSGTVDADTVGSYTRTATATNAIDTTTQDYSITVNAAPDVFVDAGEILRVTLGQPTVHIHNGTAIPETSPIDTNGHIWKQFNLDNLATGESLSSTPTVLINNVVVSASDEQDGMTFHEIVTDGESKVKVRLEGAQEGQLYTLTIRYTTNYTPSDDRSQKFYGRSL